MARSVRNRARMGAALSAAALAAAALTATLAPVAHAAPATGSGGSGGNGVVADTTRHCVILLDKIKPGEDTSRVRAKECAIGKKPEVAANSVLLMTWYQLTKYGGESTYIEGGAKCDSEGYGIRDVGAGMWDGPWWNNRISSFKVYNNCDYTTLYNGYNYGGDRHKSYRGNENDVGNYMDNRTSSLTIRDN